MCIGLHDSEAGPSTANTRMAGTLAVARTCISETQEVPITRTATGRPMGAQPVTPQRRIPQRPARSAARTGAADFPSTFETTYGQATTTTSVDYQGAPYAAAVNGQVHYYVDAYKSRSPVKSAKIRKTLEIVIYICFKFCHGSGLRASIYIDIGYNGRAASQTILFYSRGVGPYLERVCDWPVVLTCSCSSYLYITASILIVALWVLLTFPCAI